MSTARLRTLAVALGLVPAVALGVRAALDDLGANPIEEITHETGGWALRFLLLALAVTPLRRLTGWSRLAALRRTLGLTAFGYATLHVLTYFGLDHLFDLGAALEDVLERRYVTAGMAAYLCLVPLALTSTDRMVRRLGRRWKALHRLAYAAAVLAVVHFVWLVKADLREPGLYAALLALLLGYRAWRRLSAPRAAPDPRAAAR